MARLYTLEEKEAVLQSLRIKPIDGKVTGKEATLILQWRAREEFGIHREYDDSSLRQHLRQKNLHAEPGNRKSRYLVEEIFDLMISPKRGRATKTEKSKDAA